ncbi:hypothetical protein QBC44DRAFT_374951 [Cladorrhinum sp. PSN332]|nr:hypothetical protein QBC44DRAFT_374951 [Cladorrhinum sp. PSN332]
MPLPSAESSAGSGSEEFSRANVIGMFLTLSLCLLTQPFGSLIYRPWTSKSSRLRAWAFMLWRLNPILCMHEYLLVIIWSLRVAMDIWKKQDSPIFSRQFPFAHPNMIPLREWRKQFHINAAALLLLRANDYGHPDGEPTLTDRLLEIGSTVENTDSLSSTASTTSTAQPGVPRRRRTSLAEEGRFHSRDPEIEISGVHETTLVKEALGKNVLAQQEKWINILTGFSVLTVALKLTSSKLPWSVRIPALFSMAGWFGIYFVLVCFHAQELEQKHVEEVLSVARKTRRRLKHTFGRPIIDCDNFIPLFYFGVTVLLVTWGTSLDFSKAMPLDIEGTGWNSLLGWEWLWLPLWVLGAVGCALWSLAMVADVVIIVGAAVYVFFEREWVALLAGAATIPIMVWVGVVAGLPLLANFWYVGTEILLVCALALLVAALMKPSRNHGFGFSLDWAWMLSFGLYANLFVALYLFAVLLANHDPSETSKPHWLEYLG